MCFVQNVFAVFCSSSFFLNTNFTEKTVDVSGIRTRFVGVEGEHANHTTTSSSIFYLLKSKVQLDQSYA